jgi:hypothetical protein
MDEKNAGRSVYFKGPNSYTGENTIEIFTVPRIFNNRLYSCCCVLDAAWLIRENPARFPKWQT